MRTKPARTLSTAAAALCVSLLITSRPGTAQSQSPALAHKPESMFAPSTECLACHNNLAGPDGEDVSIGASWRGSMMANSARDPYVLASVRRETIDHATHAAEIEDECAACHMPAAKQMAHAAGTKASMLSQISRVSRGSQLPRHAADRGHDSEMARDGVTCTVCHQMSADRLGTPESFNGNFVVPPPLANGRRRAFGPFQPEAGRRRIMSSVTGFEQEQASHIRESELCASCHTLITTAIGPDGRVIGSLPEQMNYQEWRHSAFVAERRGCQSCHMPAAGGPVRVASVLGEPRDRLARHTFVGGNAFMLRLMNYFRSEIGVAATSAELDATARATIRQLERDTASLTIERAATSGGVLTVAAAVRNLTGHKFPTGYPSRRAWLHLVARDANGNTLFESGRVAETGRIDGEDRDAADQAFEPHHDEITSADQVQVYESVMGTPSGQPTTGLLQATHYLKDNRLLPRGFDKTTASPEIAVIGHAAADEDFTGGEDRVRYRVPLAATGAATGVATGTGAISVTLELRYQPIAYRWARNLDGYDAPEPRAFVRYYNALASSSSVIIATAEATVTPQ
jgi:cytochrome c551/c552